MKKHVFIFGCLIAFIVTNSFAQMAYDYGSALDAAIKFYDAQRCGPDAGTGNLFSWRGACHTADKDGSVDLTGGYHDAGDFPKFGLPQCWSAATLGWAMYEYPSVFASKKDAYFRMLKWFTDYFLKCHSSTGTFYYHVGDGNADHGYWGSPEAQPSSIPRTPLKAPPGSDVCAEAAAALALMYLNYKSTDAAYAQRCLDAAKDLWAIAFANCNSKATARSSDNAGGNFYKTSSHYDDMCWAAIWLYTATGTASYLDSVDHWSAIPNDPGDNQYQKKWTPAWDDAILFVLLKMAAITGNDKYYQGVVFNLDWCMNQANKSAAGLPIIDQWGVLRYASAEAGLGYLAYKLLGYKGFNTKANFIIDYCLGTNPDGRSYLTGWGKNPPIHPSHRANEPVRGGAVKGLIGGLVGGPTNDAYEDNVDKYQVSEVALDYNASFILGLAGQIYVKNGGLPKNRPPSVVIASPKNGVAVPQGATINFKVTATDADGKVTKIELFKGDQSVATATTSPLNYAWQNAPLGDAIFKATAIDDSGNVSNFTTATIHVTAPCTPGSMMSRVGWEATASNHSPNAPEDPSSALDGDVATRYSSGAGLSSGMWFQLDMGYPRDFDQIVIESSASDFPEQGFSVYATNDTSKLGTAIFTGAATVKTTVTPSTPASSQYIRLVSGTGSGNWWSINEINVRCSSPTNTRFTGASREKTRLRMDVFPQMKSVLVNYSVPEPGRVALEEFSLNGSRMGVLVDGYREAGNYFVTCNTNRCAANMVLFKFSYKGSSQLQRAVLIK
jgi:endoglucanase